MSWVSRFARAHARVSVAAHRAVQAADGVVAGLLDAALTAEEKTRLGVSLYDGAPHYRAEGALHSWERRWFERVLPPAPARVLVGGCGAGREIGALTDRGYVVGGFEPAASLLRLAVSRHPSATLWQDTYESWADRSGEGSDYDAIVLGWGSLSHVLSPSARVTVLRAAVARCPEGPILASYWVKTTDPAAARARRIGAWLGARLGDGMESGDAYLPNTGFVHMFDEDELVGLASQIGRTATFEGGPSDYPHVTFE